MKNLPIDKLDPNPHRDLKVYKIRPAHVERIKQSILLNPDEPNFWAGVVARPHPEKKGRYQITHGHHRIEAAKAAGVKEIPVQVMDLDDTQMREVMIAENAIQGGGAVAADADAVLATARDLWRENLSLYNSTNSNNKSHPREISVGLALQGNAISYQALLEYSAALADLGQSRVRAAIEYLRDTNQWPDVYQPVGGMSDEDAKLCREAMAVQKREPQILNPEAFEVFNMDKPAQGKAFQQAMRKYWTYVTFEDQVIIAQDTFDALKKDDPYGENIRGTKIIKYIDKLYKDASARKVMRRGQTVEARGRLIDNTFIKLGDSIRETQQRFEYIAAQIDEMQEALNSARVATLKARAKQISHLSEQVNTLSTHWTNLWIDQKD